MTVAITGSTGFVGRAVLDIAASQVLSVRALARRVPEEDLSGVEWIEGDLANRDALSRLVDGADAVIHIAGLTNTHDLTQFDTVNVLGTQTLLEATRAAGVKRFVFVSSLSAREPKLSAYGVSKAKAETVVEASGLDWSIVRPPAVYGPRDTEMFELFRTARSGFVPLPPRGATSIIHVEDLARLLVALTTAKPGDARHRLFEPDDGREGGWSHKELAHSIGLAVGRTSVFAPNLPASVLRAGAAIDGLVRRKKAKLTADRVGYMIHPNWVARFDRRVPVHVWQPEIEGLDGLARTAQWYREAGWL